MTNEQPTIQRALRRRSDDRVIGGVASGLGDYLNVDPLLIRIGLVGLMVFGGMGLVLYAAAWLLIPDDATDRSIVERVLGRERLGGTALAIVLVLVLVGASVFFSVVGSVEARSGGGFGFLGLALAVIVVGVLLLRRGEPAPASAENSDAGTAATPTAPPERAAARRPRRAPSPLGGYVIGSGLAAVGVLALLANVTGADVAPAHYFGVALGVIGVGLVIGTWWGHARGLILLGLLLLPFAITASFVTAPLEGGFGDQRFRPTTVEELRDEYRLAGGELVLDLTQVNAGSEPIAVAASIGMGHLVVLLPDDAGAEIDAEVGAGELAILDARDSGTTLAEREVIEGDGQRFRLDLEAGVGRIRVDTITTEHP
ncbi:MAG TPA: PspC domain-containing protein [Candidatus Limnocylindria bacterium]|nr:PspC domain-containing protein [Candidatus Limnocylindria bacterium]